MALQCCSNPREIKRHYRNKYASQGTEVVEESFCEQFSAVCKNLKAGMIICATCKNKIMSTKFDFPTCVDPFLLGPHSSSKYINISENVQREFYSLRYKLPLNSTLCCECHERLKKQPNVRKVPPTEDILEICCNPFYDSDHSSGKNARPITQEMINRYSSETIEFFLGDHICSNCRLLLYRNFQTQKIKPKNDVPAFRYTTFLSGLHFIDNILLLLRIKLRI